MLEHTVRVGEFTPQQAAARRMARQETSVAA
jgi:hypothetical protein